MPVFSSLLSPSIHPNSAQSTCPGGHKTGALSVSQLALALVAVRGRRCMHAGVLQHGKGRLTLIHCTPAAAIRTHARKRITMRVSHCQQIKQDARPPGAP